ncbi:hypothetical protein BKA70DRAFT_1394128 [Coprinopsis sp. MPI-PUGE-AT-0042]|nr:hypothetical protein BKA70DRAFT_1394128 [Coprinopsis sp. MPI-PUGE-AT-0042]
MDASSELSDLEETQATQMMADLLVPGSSPIKSPDAPARPSKITFQSDLTESFHSSRNSNYLPTYNLHGLAATQTQTPVGEGEEDSEEALEGSQKENIQGPGAVKEHRTTPGPFRPGQNRESPSRTNGKAPMADKGAGSLAHSKTRTPNAKPLPITSLQSHTDRGQARASGSSPSKPDATNAIGRTTRSSRAAPPPPVPAEDSFAAFDPDFDTEEPPLANRHFDVPLSQLAGSQDDSGIASSSRQNHRVGPPAMARDFMLPPPMGRVLVESTPTNSVSSQADSSHEYSRREIIETQIIGHGQGISQESDYGKSLLRPPAYRFTPEPSQSYEATQPATQPSTQPSTQPATQIATQIDDTQMVDTTHPSVPSAPSAPSFPQTGTNPGQSIPQSHQTTNSLLRGMPLGKLHRYAKYANTPATTLDRPLPSRQVPPQQPQPQISPSSHHKAAATDPAPVKDMLPPTRRQVPSRPTPSPNKAGPSAHVRERTPDAMEVVPDSEAFQSSPQRPDDAKASNNAKKAKRQMEPSSMAAQKGDTEDEEEDGEEDELSEAPKGKGKKVAKRQRKRKVVTPPTSSGSESEVVEPPAKRRAIARQDSSEDDVPLSAKARSSKSATKVTGKSKDKGKAAEPKAKSKAAVAKQSTVAPKKIVADSRNGASNTRSWEDSIVPSSMPEQDFPQAKSKGPQKQTRKTSVASTSSKQLTPEEDSDDGGDDYVEEAEQVHNDDMDIIGKPPPKTRKRKREASGSKPVIKREKKTKVTPQPMKVLRSGVASAKKNIDPTRVFALWATDKHYYTGTVEYVITESQYEISFDDRNHAPVSLDELRSLDLNVGDEVMYKKKRCPVVSTHRVAQGFVTVLHDRKDVEAPLEDIRLSSKMIAAAWEDRRLEAESIVPHCQPGVSGQGTSSSRTNSGITAVGVQDARAKKPAAKLLQGIAFLLSFGGKEDDPQRNSLVSKIVKAGGKVVGFDEILPAGGKYNKNNQSWHATRDQVQWRGDKTIGSLYLLASEATKRPKYLTALALGVPCVSHEWIETSLAHGELRDWRYYLLPHGQSDHLRKTISQMVDLKWGTDPAQLTDIMCNPVPFRLLEGEKILMLGKHWFKDHGVIVDPARVIFAMGADHIDGAPHPRWAPENLDSYTYIITYKADEGLGFDVPEAQRRDWPWVMDCLLSNRLILQATDGEDQSQEV